MKKTLYYLIIISTICIWPHVILASNIGIAVDQTAIVFDVDTGESQEFVVEVKNISDKKQKIEIGTIDYALSDNNEMTLLSNSDEINGIEKWVKPENESIVLKPGEAKEEKFYVKTPDDVSIGSHRGAVLFRAMPNDDDTVKVQGQIGVHVLINVKGDTHAGGHINKFDIPLMSINPIKYEVEFENTGNIHYVPYAEIVLHNIFTKNKQLYKYDKHFVFPGKKFIFSHVEKIPSSFGLYKASVIFVDGEGIMHVKSDYTMGYLFPLIFTITIGIIVIIIERIFEIGKKRKKKEVSQDKKFQLKIKK